MTQHGSKWDSDLKSVLPCINMLGRNELELCTRILLLPFRYRCSLDWAVSTQQSSNNRGVVLCDLFMPHRLHVLLTVETPVMDPKTKQNGPECIEREAGLPLSERRKKDRGNFCFLLTVFVFSSAQAGLSVFYNLRGEHCSAVLAYMQVC